MISYVFFYDMHTVR